METVTFAAIHNDDISKQDYTNVIFGFCTQNRQQLITMQNITILSFYHLCVCYSQTFIQLEYGKRVAHAKL